MAAFFRGGERFVQILGTKPLDCDIAVLVAEWWCVLVGKAVAPAGRVVRFRNGDHASDRICGLGADKRRDC